MPEKEKPVLSDKQTVPTEEILSSLLGERWHLWQEINKFAADSYKDVSGTWNWYNDGKQWLYKFVQKKKTLFWGAIFEDTFRITFYFGAKAEPVITGSSLPEKVKQEFLTGPRYGKIRSISRKVFNKTDVDIVKGVLEIKVKIK
jgi:hypothetical protein